MCLIFATWPCGEMPRKLNAWTFLARKKLREMPRKLNARTFLTRKKKLCKNVQIYGMCKSKLELRLPDTVSYTRLPCTSHDKCSQAFPIISYSYTSVYYTEHKQKSKNEEAWERDYIHSSTYPSFFSGRNWIPNITPQESRNVSSKVYNWLRIVHTLTDLSASFV